MAVQATYMKLRDGSWGIRVTGAVPVLGDTFTVSKRDGSTKQETVNMVMGDKGGVYFCAIKATPRPAAATARSSRRPLSGLGSGCGQCRALGRMCRQCRFDEYDD